VEEFVMLFAKKLLLGIMPRLLNVGKDVILLKEELIIQKKEK